MISLRTRLLLLTLLAAIPLGLMIVYNSLEERGSDLAAERESLLARTKLAADSANDDFAAARQVVLVLARSRIPRLPPPACNGALAHLLDQFAGVYVNLAVADRTGELRCSGLPLTAPINVADRSYFRRAVESRSVVTGDFEIGRLTDRPLIAVASPELDDEGRPYLDEQGDVRAVVYAALSTAHLTEALTAIPLPPGGVAFVVDRNGTVLAHVPDAQPWVGQSMATAPHASTRDRAGMDTTEVTGEDGIHRLYAFASLGPDAGEAMLAIGIPSDHLASAADRALLSNLVGLLVVGALVLGAARVGANRLVLTPVNRLVATTRRLATGDLGARTGLPRASGEIGHLIHAVDDMAAALEQQMTSVQRAEAETRTLNAELERRVADRTAQLEAMNRELEAFSYSVSHDLRAPLRSVEGFSRALEEDYAGRLDEQGEDYLRRIHAAAQRMQHLIDDLLALSRVARADLQREPVDLSQVARTIAAELRDQHPDRAVTFEIADGLPAVCDRRLLQVALTNLMENAWKFTRNTRNARIEVAATPLPDGTRAFVVRDNGAGFDMTNAERLFGAFQRLHTEHEFEGTGIGLATVQRVIHRHGGRVWAEGVVGQGAAFFFTVGESARRDVAPRDAVARHSEHGAAAMSPQVVSDGAARRHSRVSNRELDSRRHTTLAAQPTNQSQS